MDPNPESPVENSESQQKLLEQAWPIELANQKTARWETIFKTVVITDPAEQAILESGAGGATQYLNDIDVFVDCLAKDPTLLPFLKTYRLFIHGKNDNADDDRLRIADGNVRVPMKFFLRYNGRQIADIAADGIYKKEGLSPITAAHEPEEFGITNAEKDSSAPVSSSPEPVPANASPEPEPAPGGGETPERQELLGLGEYFDLEIARVAPAFKEIDVHDEIKKEILESGRENVEALCAGLGELVASLSSVSTEVVKRLRQLKLSLTTVPIQPPGFFITDFRNGFGEEIVLSTEVLLSYHRNGEIEWLTQAIERNLAFAGSEGGVASSPAPEAPPAGEKSPEEKMAALLARWESENKLPSRVDRLKKFAEAPCERWPLLLAELATDAATYGVLSFEEFGEISAVVIGESITPDQLAERNRTAAETVPAKFESKKYDAEKKRQDPIHVFMRDVMHLSDEEIEAINFEYSVVLSRESKEGDPGKFTATMLSCSNYHDFLRERQKISPAERLILDQQVWNSGGHRFSKVSFLARKNFWKRLEDGGDLNEYHDDFYNLMNYAVRGEYLPDDFATWAKEEGAKDDSSAAEPDGSDAKPAGENEKGGEKKKEDGKEKEPSELEKTREAYAREYNAYLEKNRKRSGAFYGIGGNNAELEAARKIYDEELKLEAEFIRGSANLHFEQRPNDFIGSLPLAIQGQLKNLDEEARKVIINEQITARANKRIFEELVVQEEEFIAKLHAGDMPPQEQGFCKRMWLAYARMPRWQKIAISSAIGLGFTAVSGGTSIFFYAGRKAGSILASGGAFTAATFAIEGYDRTAKGKRGTKEYKLDQLIQSKKDDITGNLDACRQEYKEILEQQVVREKKRLYLKIAFAALIGAGTSFAAGVAEHAVAPGVASNIDHHGAAPKAPAAHPTEASVKPSPVPSTTEQTAPPASQASSDATYPDRPPLNPDYVEQPSGGAGTHAQIGTPDHAEAPAAGNNPPAAPEAPHTAETPTAPSAPSAPSGSHTENVPPPSAPAEAPATPTMPSAEHIVEIKSGDSLWKVTANELKDNDDFDKLNDAQKTWMLSTLTNRAIEHHDAVHVDDAGNAAIGTKVNLSGILKSDDINDLVHRAGNLTETQQANILHNNQAIADWLNKNPHKPLTGAQVEDILKPHHAETPEPAHPDATPEQAAPHALETPPHQTAPGTAAIPQEPSSHAMPPEKPIAPPINPHALPDSAPSHASETPITVPLQSEHLVPHPTAEHTLATPEAVKNSIKHWHVKDAASGTKLMREIGDLGRLPLKDRAELFSAIAKKVGDKSVSAVIVSRADPSWVAERMKDYLVAYPEARQLGFHNYHEYAGMKDVTVGKFVNSMPPSNELASALHHPLFWHNSRGGYIEELRNGALRRIPLKVEHVKLGMAIAETTHPGDMTKTIGEILADRPAEIESHTAFVKKAIGDLLNRGQ